jgi:hypothetical protein
MMDVLGISSPDIFEKNARHEVAGTLEWGEFD